MDATKPTVYIETSIISYLAARPSGDIIAAGKQSLTWIWWDGKRHAFNLLTSPTVIEEAMAGDPDAAARRLELLKDIPLVATSDASRKLAAELTQRMRLPPRANPDAAHIATAAANGAHYLLTWNCTHIANAMLRPIIEKTCRSNGFEPPVICTPEQLQDV